ncbi:tellurite resistance TerB family protein [Pseudochelatococcus sp. G4_1912]|uniref:tellurite resistance TerB family protein n=1 Tax=Pseudochelatococcus sp. G4_1912 TaxID=3114288 RepID=UPI0039C6432E
MLDAKKLLDALIGSAAVSPASKRASDTDISSRMAGGNDAFGSVGDMLGSVIGQLTGQQSGQPGSVTEAGGDLITQARQYLDTPQGRNIASAVAGGLAGLLLGSRSSGKSITSSAASLGGIALIGGLAYKAYQNWQRGEPAYATDKVVLAPPADSVFGAEKASQDTALVLLRATIAAASSDGQIDTEERGRIISGLSEAGLQTEVATFLDREFADPASITQLASAATSEEIAVEIYTAARLAIEPDTPSERAFLKELAQALSLPADLVAHIDATAGAAKENLNGASA